MKRRRLLHISRGFVTLALLFSVLGLVVFAQRGAPPAVEYQHVETVVLPNGREAEQVIINGPPEPPPGYVRPLAPSAGPGVTAAATLSVPAYNWSFGCSATSAAMIAAYYDRTGYPNIYTGPTNGGVMPMDNSVWPDWVDSGGDTRSQCPLSATRNGLDGRTARGHVDDYWVQYGHAGPDPYVTSGWTEHTLADCTGDFMKTNRAATGNSDGATTFYFYTNGAPLPADDMETHGIDEIDGGYGVKLFYESRGYTVTSMYNQYIYGYASPSAGFTYEQYKAEIDAGRPVMFHVAGHTMVGVGYDDTSSNLMYIHDTWDYSTHTMEWGGSYSGMVHYGVTIVRLAAPSGPDAPTLTSPANGSSTCDSTPGFSWTTASGATSYRIQVDDGAGFGSPEINVTTSSTSYTPGTGLLPATYYWRVQASNAWGDSPWSPVWSFTTLATPSAPSLTSPADSSSTCDTTPSFSWGSVSGAASYRIQVDDSAGFGSPEINAITSSTSYTPGTALSPGTYYWRVQASNACGDGSWSTVWSFTIVAAPSTPNPSSPADGSTVDDSTPTFSWAGVSGATSYRIQVDDSDGFGSPEVDAATSSTSYTPGTALPDGIYFWRVLAANACGDGSWSPVWSFTILSTPSAPSLTSPADGSTTCDTMPAFSWTSTSGATSYRIQVDDSASFLSPEVDTTTSGTSYTPGTALAPGTYNWRVQASGSSGDCAWSTVWSFSILPTPSAASPSSPTDGSSTCDTTPGFTWSSASGATSYRIQVDDSASFGSPEMDSTTPNTSYTPGTDLSPGAYYWRVQASSACGDATWSPVWTFTILPTPSTPTPSSPADGSTVDDETPTFSWASVGGATLFRIQVDDSAGFGSPEIDSTTSSTWYTPGTALPDGVYFWRVQASTACGTGTWSATWQVTIDTAGGGTFRLFVPLVQRNYP